MMVEEEWMVIDSIVVDFQELEWDEGVLFKLIYTFKCLSLYLYIYENKCGGWALWLEMVKLRMI